MNQCHAGPSLTFLTAEDLAADVPDCWGSLMDGPAACTCWEPIFDLEQREPDVAAWRSERAGIVTTRPRRCHDCAFRPDSPERARGDELEALDNFWCHQGIRRAVAYRHPDGRVRPAGEGDYQPPITADAPWRADGTPAERCAGHAQAQRHLVAAR